MLVCLETFQHRIFIIKAIFFYDLLENYSWTLWSLQIFERSLRACTKEFEKTGFVLRVDKMPSRLLGPTFVILVNQSIIP